MGGLRMFKSAGQFYKKKKMKIQTYPDEILLM